MACIRPKIGLCWAWSKTPVMPLCVRRQDQDVKPALRRFRGAAPRGCHAVQRSKAGQPAASLNCCASQGLELSASSSHRGVQLRTLPSSEPTSCSWRECPRASSSEVSHCCSRRCFLAWCLMVSQHPHHVSPLLIDQPGNLWSHGFCLAFFPCLRLSHFGCTFPACRHHCCEAFVQSLALPISAWWCVFSHTKHRCRCARLSPSCSPRASLLVQGFSITNATERFGIMLLRVELKTGGLCTIAPSRCQLRELLLELRSSSALALVTLL